MSEKSVHEPEALLMDAEAVAQDAARLAALLQENRLERRGAVQMRIPLSVFLEALDSMEHSELLLLKQRVNEKLGAT